MSDEPLLPYTGERRVGEVIDLAEVRIRWGQPSPKAPKPCEHRNIVFSTTERRVWCEDCERTIDNFDAFHVLTKNFEAMLLDLRVKASKADAAMTSTLVRRAAKDIDRTWGHGMAPACPHCGQGLLPEDFANGARSAYGRDYEMARRKRKAEAVRTGGEPAAEPRGDQL